MSIIEERGLFVRLPVQSGTFESSAAAALMDALDATTREPAMRAGLQERWSATKADLDELRAGTTLVQLRVDEFEKRVNIRFDAVDKRFDAVVEKLFVRMIGAGIAVAGLTAAAPRLT